MRSPLSGAGCRTANEDRYFRTRENGEEGFNLRFAGLDCACFEGYYPNYEGRTTGDFGTSNIRSQQYFDASWQSRQEEDERIHRKI